MALHLAMGPGVLGRSASTQNAVIVGFLLILTEVVTLSVFEPWEEWLNVLLGGWLVVSPWVLGATAVLSHVHFVIVGAVVAVLAIYELMQVRNIRPPAS